MMRFSAPKIIINLIFKLRRFRYRAIDEQSENALILTYLCPNAKKASGGVKVIYRHVSQINQMQIDGVKAQIFHPKDLSFRCDLKFANLRFKNNFTFNKKNEVLVIHEMWAAREAEIAYSKGIRYIIQVQNGYEVFRKADKASIYNAYLNAELITCISDDIYECLTFLFPEFAYKIHRIHLSVESELFKPAHQKENLITYMPRKLEKHSKLVLSYIAGKLPDNWSVFAIQNMDQTSVAEVLSRSKIFLSFSELEGLGLPPLEAALAGNLVVGYTGEAGKEYWLKKQFQEISCGNILRFSQTILQKIEDISKGELILSEFDENIHFLKKKYNAIQELEDLREMTNRLMND